MPPLVYARPVHNASLSSWSIESRKQCIQQLYRILRILNTNTDRTGLNRGIVITRRRHAITHEHHFIGPYAKCLRQLAHGIGLIDAAFADIHTGVSAGPDPHMRQIGLDRFDQRLFLRVIAIPCLLGRYGANCPRAEKVIWLPLFSIRGPHTCCSHNPSSRACRSRLSETAATVASDRSCAYTKAHCVPSHR